MGITEKLDDIDSYVKDLESELDKAADDLNELDGTLTSFQSQLIELLKPVVNCTTLNDIEYAVDDLVDTHTFARADETVWQECKLCGKQYPYPITQIEDICRYCVEIR